MLFHPIKRHIPPTIKEYRDKHHPNRVEGGLRVHNNFHRKSETDRPLVTIVTVVFNGEHHLEGTIKSTLHQTYDNIEYIVIDGGSTDGTIDVLRKYSDKIAYWISEPDEGIGDAFNKGIAASTGEIIGIINADDWYSLNAVETIVAEYKKEGDCIYHAKLQYWDSDMNPYYIFSGDADRLLTRGTINHPTVFVPKKTYEEIGLFNTAFKNAVDYEWLIRAKLHGVSFCYIDQITANMRLDGKSDKKWLNNYVEIFRARDLHGVRFLRNSFWFVQMVIITFSRKLFESFGLHCAVRLYRRYFSVTKKYLPVDHNVKE